MIDPDLLDRVYQMFVVEVPMMLQTIEMELLSLDFDRTATRVNNLLRAAHSIKGGAAILGLKKIEHLAHQLEDIFHILNHPELSWDCKLEELLFKLYDYLAQLVNCEISGKPIPSELDPKIQLVLADLDAKIGDFSIIRQTMPDTTIFGLDVTQSIFEIDVAHSLSRIKRVLFDPNCDDLLVPEFRAQSEVFTGIAELVNLPGFGEIAHATIAALDLHPDRKREICCFALVDFYAALEAVLTGDRVSGGKISPGLAAMLTELPRPLGIEDAQRNLFDLEDLFDRPQWLMSSQIDSEGALDLIADFLDRSSGEDRTVDRLATPVELVSPLIDPGTDWLDYLIEDLLTAPAIPVFIEVGTPCENFDLVDIFDRSTTVETRSLIANVNPQLLMTIEQIISNFASFSPVSHSELQDWRQPPSSQLTPLKPTKIAVGRKIGAIVASQLTVRVGFDRLERMNNLVGELAIERNGLALHRDETIDTLQELRTKCLEFQTISTQLQQIADRISIFDRPNASLSNQLNEQFDALELDRYSELHHIAQATAEQLAQIEEKIEDLTLFHTQSHRQIARQKQLLTDLRADLMWARMLPLSEILNRFPRTIHDLSVKYQKPVELKITGAGVLVDRAAIDKLLDPLVHILRNAFDHGIDPLAARQAAGKPAKGLISINAYHQGSQTMIEVKDDGGGIEIPKVKAKAIALKLIPDDATVTNEQILDLLFSPGFSTADRVTELSGRGMGLDIVRSQIQAIKGTISIDSQLGRGTTFTLRIPLTLTIAQLTIVSAGNGIYAFPTDSIQRIIVPTAEQIEQQGEIRTLHWHNLHIPIYQLWDLLAYSTPIPEQTISYTLNTAAKNPLDWLPPILLIRLGTRVVGLQIDRTIGEQELTIKPFGKAITPPVYSYGCTILGDGSILPVIDPHSLIRFTIDNPHCLRTTNLPIPAPISTTLILVVDDSVTTRQSLCLTLEKHGYRTAQAKDGQEALELLRQKLTEINLVICDVEMPNLNGFEFLNIRRQDPTISHIPVAMLTSRSNTKHRQFATHLGAIAYFVKPYVEGDFIKAIDRLVKSPTPG